ncbi:hypothetical protein [Priestia sp. GS2]|uniref:hypothetical protein n=1 Tax=Priestia sp. GS2 TaxID=3117403 RepID=UPI002EDB068A
MVVPLLAANIKEDAIKLEELDSVVRIEESDMPTQQVNIPDAEELNVACLIDASKSMNRSVIGGQKMELGKQVVRDYVNSLLTGANISLRVYGHKGSKQESDKFASCQSNEVVYSSSIYNQDKFEKALASFEATGWTPFASAI